MLHNQGQAAEIVKLLDPAAAGTTAAATSAWIDARKYEGDLVFTAQTGAFTGAPTSFTWTIEDATDGAGTGAAGVTPNEGAFAAGAANQIQTRTVNASAIRGWIRIVGTIVGGTTPTVESSANVMAHPKYTS
jgi:hypothetical protein